MPTRNKCWAAWNYSIGDTQYLSDITYYMNKLQNIDARSFFWPLSSTSIPGRKAFNKKYLSESIHKRALNLPSSFEIKNSEIDYICDLIKKYLSKMTKTIFF